MIDNYSVQQMFADSLTFNRKFTLTFPNENLVIFFDNDETFCIRRSEIGGRIPIEILRSERYSDQTTPFFDFFYKLLALNPGRDSPSIIKTLKVPDECFFESEQYD